MLPTKGGNATYAPGEAIVRFEVGTPTAARRDARSGANVEFEDTLGLPRAQLVSVEGPVKAAVRRLERQPGVAYAQPNYHYEAQAEPAPNDTFFGELWGLSDPAPPEPGVGVLDAWESNRGSGQVIAVLDTGVDLTHPDIIGNLWTNPSPDPIDEDEHGFDFVDDDGDPDDYNFHGTHVAGTAAATADNDEGIAGVAPQAEIMAVRVLDGDGSGDTAEIAAGVSYAAEHGADVINMSLSGPSGLGDKVMEDAIEAAAEANVVTVVAAGNDGANNDVAPRTPCALPVANLVCVAALNQAGSLAGFSNYGAKFVDIAAPGTSIVSAKPDYGPSLFSDDFESGIGLWSTTASNGGSPWGLSDSAANGLQSAADSPAGNYGAAEPGGEDPAASRLFTTSPVSLAAQRGCRLHFSTKYRTEADFDIFAAGAVSEELSFDWAEFDGASSGYPTNFSREDASVSELDGRTDVHTFFGVFSDEEIEFDGAYVDDVRLFCRDQTYVNAIASASNYDQPESGSYVRFQGTSMATPHVAGVVALVRAAAPSLNAQEVVQAVLKGASALPMVTAGKRTATEGIADACKAIAVATGGDVAAECPASSEPVLQPPPPDGTATVGEPDAEAPTPSPTTPTPRSSKRKSKPNTFIRRHPTAVLKTETGIATAIFRFGSNEAGVTFLCKVDRRPFRVCPQRLVRRFRLGAHVLRVKARDQDGDTDQTPAIFRLKVRPIGSG